MLKSGVENKTEDSTHFSFRRENRKQLILTVCLTSLSSLGFPTIPYGIQKTKVKKGILPLRGMISQQNVTFPHLLKFVANRSLFPFNQNTLPSPILTLQHCKLTLRRSQESPVCCAEMKNAFLTLTGFTTHYDGFRCILFVAPQTSNLHFSIILFPIFAT